MTSFFIFLSIGVSVLKLGLEFTSNNHGFNLLSTSISIPKTSKHI